MSTTSVYYIDPGALADEIREYYRTGVPTDTLGNYVLRMAEGVLSTACFRDYSTTWRDDMLSEAVARGWGAIRDGTIKEDRLDKAFLYLSRTMWNAAVSVLRASKQRNLDGLRWADWARHTGLAATGADDTAARTAEEADDMASFVEGAMGASD